MSCTYVSIGTSTTTASDSTANTRTVQPAPRAPRAAARRVAHAVDAPQLARRRARLDQLRAITPSPARRRAASRCARAGWPRPLSSSGDDRLARERAHARVFAEGLLHDAILERVEADDGDPSAGLRSVRAQRRARRASAPSSSLTAMRSAWNVRVAGGCGRAPARARRARRRSARSACRARACRRRAARRSRARCGATCAPRRNA